MSRRFIVVGDTTSHGGIVIQGSPGHAIDGRAMARLGDAVDCPEKYPGGRPHGVNKIVEGDATFLVDGMPVACEGHRTECGCTLVGSVRATVG